MISPDQYDDYLRDAAGLDYFDGPPVTLTLAQARNALNTLAADADKYRDLLLRALRNARPQATDEALAAYETQKQPAA